MLSIGNRLSSGICSPSCSSMYSRNHLDGDCPGVDRQVSSRPEISSPELLFQMRKLLQQHPGAYPLEPLHNRADVLVRPIGQEHMNMILRHLPRQNHKLVFPCYLPDQISHSKCDLSPEHTFAIFRYPHQVNFEVMLRVRAESILSHARMQSNPLFA